MPDWAVIALIVVAAVLLLPLAMVGAAGLLVLVGRYWLWVIRQMGSIPTKLERDRTPSDEG
jgi:hypothetical protein